MKEGLRPYPYKNAAFAATEIPHSSFLINKGCGFMPKVTFDADRCKGCGLCVAACPKKLLVLAADKINKKGHSPAEITDQAACIGCAFCATMCPDCVITVEK